MDRGILKYVVVDIVERSVTLFFGVVFVFVTFATSKDTWIPHKTQALWRKKQRFSNR